MFEGLFRKSLIAALVAIPLASAGTARAQVQYFGYAFSALLGEANTAFTDVPATYSSNTTEDLTGLAVSRSSSARGGSVFSSSRTLAAGEYARSLVHIGDTNLRYNLQIVGPTLPTVAIRVQAHGYATGNFAYISSALFSLTNSAGNLVREVTSAAVFGRQEFTINEVIRVAPNSDVSIYLRSFASTGEEGPLANQYNGYAEAFVDPVFTLEPEFASQYSIVGVPGMGEEPGGPGGSVVPEPATWALMLGGFGVVGGALRRRRLAVPGVAA